MNSFTFLLSVFLLYDCWGRIYTQSGDGVDPVDNDEGCFGMVSSCMHTVELPFFCSQILKSQVKLTSTSTLYCTLQLSSTFMPYGHTLALSTQ